MKTEELYKYLISFGNYLLSDERNVSDINKQNVTDADLSNWEHLSTFQACVRCGSDNHKKRKEIEMIKGNHPFRDRYCNDCNEPTITILSIRETTKNK